MPTVRSRRVLLAAPLAAAVVSLVVLAGCGERTRVTVTELGGGKGGGGDVGLPDAVVTTRVDPPPTSWTLECPWGVVDPDPASNPAWAGNLGPDQIPAIDDPAWRPVSAPDLALLDSEPVLVVERHGLVRIAPVRVMLHHEVLSLCWDGPGGAEFTYLTYCPLTDAAVHFTDSRACSAKFKFGVSGSVFNWNLVTYDEASLRAGSIVTFVQMYAGGVFGSCAPADAMESTMTWRLARTLFPEGRVLSANTGFSPAGGYDFFDQPYWDYWRVGLSAFDFPLAVHDTRLPDMAPVLGVILPGGARRAYRIAGGEPVVNDTIAGEPVVVFVEPGFSHAAAFEPRVDAQVLTFRLVGRERHDLAVYEDAETGSLWNVEGIAIDGPLAGRRLPRVMSMRAFWFAWAAMFPGTGLHDPSAGSAASGAIGGASSANAAPTRTAECTPGSKAATSR